MSEILMNKNLPIFTFKKVLAVTTVTVLSQMAIMNAAAMIIGLEKNVKIMITVIRTPV